MTKTKALIKKNPVLTYYVLTFVISWGTIFTLIGFRGIPATREQFDSALPVAILAVLSGPVIASILLIGLTDGRAGFRELRSRFFKRQVRCRWYIVAFLAAPLTLVASFLTFSLIFPGFPPSIFVIDEKASLLLMGIISGLLVGICEELGWTGFVLPRLRLRYSIFTTGLIMGALWGAWHIASHAVLASSIYSAPFSPALYIVMRGLSLLLGPLIAFRVLMVWVYSRSESLLVAMLMHFTYTASTIIMDPTAISGIPLLTYDFMLAAMLWAIVAAVAAANRGQFFTREAGSQATKK
jgi:membrane protease YdiL (CAAX protease family)